ncbi:MAG: FAD-binding oxidoreductase, partial [Shewanella sp.]|nr:FAD-binding oxidoreductase [Shewanella sp.]
MMLARCHSYYNATINHETDFPSLTEDIHTDILVIGGGFTGVNIALELAEQGRSVVLLEANKIGWGATGRNGGQVTGSLSGDAAMTKQLRRRIGDEAENFVWSLRWRGHDIIKGRVEKYRIDCDLKYGHLHTAYKPAHMQELRSLLEEGQRQGMGAELRLLDKPELDEYLETPLYFGGLLNRKNMHLHSVNLCIGEARAAAGLGVKIFEDTK